MAVGFDPVPIVVVGLGFGRHIVDRLTRDEGNPSVRLVGVCDLDRPKADRLAREVGGLAVYDTLDEVLRAPNVPAIGLFTGPVRRAGLISQILDAGKDVITTKPFETDPHAAEIVLRRAVAEGRVVHMNSPGPGTAADLRSLFDLQTKHCLGCPVAARADVWAHYREKPDGRWYDDPESCPAAPLFRLGIYLVNDLVRVFGRARRVAAFSSRLFTKRPTADHAQLSIEFENGSLANVFSSFCVRDGDAYRNSLTINYENGTVYRNVGPVRDAKLGKATLSVIVSDKDESGRAIAETICVDSISGQYDWDGFARAVRGDPAAPVYSIDHVVEPLRIVEAMSASEKTGSVVSLNG